MNTHGISLQSLQRRSLICAKRRWQRSCYTLPSKEMSGRAVRMLSAMQSAEQTKKLWSVVSPLQLKLVMLAMQMRSNMQSVQLYSEMQEKTPNLRKTVQQSPLWSMHRRLSVQPMRMQGLSRCGYAWNHVANNAPAMWWVSNAHCNQLCPWCKPWCGQCRWISSGINANELNCGSVQMQDSCVILANALCNQHVYSHWRKSHIQLVLYANNGQALEALRCIGSAGADLFGNPCKCIQLYYEAHASSLVTDKQINTIGRQAILCTIDPASQGGVHVQSVKRPRR